MPENPSRPADLIGGWPPGAPPTKPEATLGSADTAPAAGDARLPGDPAAGGPAAPAAGPTSPPPPSAPSPSPLNGFPPGPGPDGAGLRVATVRWWIEGLRSAFFLRPRTAGCTPTPWQVLCLAVVATAVPVALARLEVAGSARFYSVLWLAGWWSVGPQLWLAWWAMRRNRPPGGPADLAAWYALSLGNFFPPMVLAGAVAVMGARGWLPLGTPTAVLAYNAFAWAVTGWAVLALVVLTARFVRSAWRTAAFAVGTAAVFAVSLWQLQGSYWWADAAPGDEAAPAVLQLSQETFEAQQAVWKAAVDGLAPERPEVADVYGLVFAPYAAEDVFRRESTMVAEVLRTRFDAAGRVLQLLNHAETANTLPWATPANLQRGIEAVAARMDREHDVLVVYLTSHGGGDFLLAADHGPLTVAPISPQWLRAALDAAGVRNRVVAVSACYSGGWVEPLQTPSSLVMTAADATHTSYGCGHRSPLTFFGRAVFDEELRRTHSFAKAFAQAVPVIRQREIDAKKPDGFSNPQLFVGEAIAPVLQALEARLGAQQPGPSAAAGVGPAPASASVPSASAPAPSASASDTTPSPPANPPQAPPSGALGTAPAASAVVPPAAQPQHAR